MGRRAATALRAVVLVAAVTVAVAAFVLGTGERAAACSCISLTDEEALANADAAFTGTLVETITAGDTHSSADAERFVFDVDEVFKGEVFARQSVVTASSGASCGLEISGVGPFVVFARTESDGVSRGAADGELYSNLCSGTRPLVTAALPAVFGTGSPPTPGASPVGDSSRPILWIAGVVGALVVVGAGWALIRRR